VSDKSRRKILKSIAAGSGAVITGKALPESWSRPVVDGVLLPAHAQTSPGRFTSGGTITLIGALGGERNYAGVMDVLTPPAQALVVPLELDADICITSNGDGTARVEALLYRTEYCEAALFSASAPIGGAAVIMSMDQECFVKLGMIERMGLVREAHAGDFYGSEVKVQIDSLDGSAVGRFTAGDGQHTLEFNIPAGACGSPSCPAECEK